MKGWGDTSGGLMTIIIPDVYVWQLNPEKNLFNVEVIGNIYENPELIGK